ncbi:hypothetical protein EDB83DRAFT_2439023 [Lactarius deliciosus]|nr:hypothetical protein EDB83DRAFT_2439023 [Lactarius deliciosus]
MSIFRTSLASIVYCWPKLRDDVSRIISRSEKFCVVVWVVVARDSFGRRRLCHLRSPNDDGFAHSWAIKLYLQLLVIHPDMQHSIAGVEQPKIACIIVTWRERRDTHRRMAKFIQAVRCGSASYVAESLVVATFTKMFPLGTSRFENLRGPASIEKLVAAGALWCYQDSAPESTADHRYHLLFGLVGTPFDPSHTLRTSAFWQWLHHLFHSRTRVFIQPMVGLGFIRCRDRYYTEMRAL